jgi:2,3-bisphosphoglycerate-dependent phosphoglycerate mutase
MLKITLLRHGRSRADDEGVFESRYDAPLTEIGCQQASEIAEKWKQDDHRKYDRIVSSPMKRTMSTAEIFADALGAPVVQSEYLLEIDAGELCGMDKQEGFRKYPIPQFINPYERIVKGTGESEAQLHSRALLAVEYILNIGCESYLVVSHGMILNAILRSMFGIPMPVNRDGVSFQFGDVGYMDIAYDEKKHQWKVLRFCTSG